MIDRIVDIDIMCFLKTVPPVYRGIDICKVLLKIVYIKGIVFMKPAVEILIAVSWQKD